jgi:hypothetical protein
VVPLSAPAIAPPADQRHDATPTLRVAAPWFAAGMAATGVFTQATGAAQWVAAAIALSAPLAARRALAVATVGASTA